MDFITKKTTHQIMPLFSGLWTSSPAKPDEDSVENREAKDKAPALSRDGDSTEGHLTDDVEPKKDRRLSTSSTTAAAASVPLPMSPLPQTRPEITKAPSNSKKRRKTRSFTPSKVFLLKAPATKRTDGKKNRLAASDVSAHFPKIHLDRDMPEDIQERLVEISSTSELDLEGYLLSTNSLSSFSLIAMDTSSRIADFSLPLHPHKVITVSFPNIANSRPRPHSRSSSLSTSSAASISSTSRKQSQKKLTQKMITMTSPGGKARSFIFDGFSYKWTIEDDARVLRKYSTSVSTSSSKMLDGELCARLAPIKRKNHSALLVDPSRCDERVAIATLFVCLRKEEGLRGLLAGIIR